MTAVEKILHKHADDAVAAAVEVGKRYLDSDKLTDAAVAWCDFFADTSAVLSKSSSRSDEEGAAVYSLLKQVLGTVPILKGWVAKCESNTEANGEPRRCFNGPLMDLLLALSGHRKHLDGLEVSVENWARARSLWTRFEVALELRAEAEFAFRLLGPVAYRPTTLECFGCTQHPRPPGDDGMAHLWLLHERRKAGCEPHDRDAAVWDELPVAALVEEPELLEVLRRWLNYGFEPPSKLEPELRSVLSTEAPTHRWQNAVTLLCSYPDAVFRESAVAALASRIDVAPDPAGEWQLFFDGRTGLRRRGLFTGNNWGRKKRSRQLLPLTRAFLRRRVWPSEPWAKALSPMMGCGSADDDCGERQREVLAEGLLDVAKSDVYPVPQRTLALEAIGALRPHGNGSWARALDKVKEPPALVELAKGVQRSIGKRRPFNLDPQLAISRACEIFFDTAAEPYD